MNILTFKYTKADGKESNRVLVVSAEPTKLYAGTDISSLEPYDMALYAEKVNKAKEAYLVALESINEEFDMNFNYRQFKPECMSNITKEEV